MNPGFHCTGQTADSIYGVVWVSGLLMSTLWIEWPMVAVGLWYGQAYVMDNEHRCIFVVWDALDRRIRQRVPVPANIQQLRTAIEEEWTNIPQATINNLINSM